MKLIEEWKQDDSTEYAFSEAGQDEWIIHNIFCYKKGGFFVDLAAAYPVIANNTYLLETRLGWKGICIEPHPWLFSQLRQHRSCYLTNAIIDFKNNNIVKFRTDNGECGGIVDVDTDNKPTIREHELKTATIVERKTKTLEFILGEFAAPSVIEYLSLDVEGAEMRVMKNFPYDRYTFLSVTIERPTIELEKLLFEKDYVFVKKSPPRLWENDSRPGDRTTYDAFYVHKSIPNFDSIEKEPYSPTPQKTR